MNGDDFATAVLAHVDEITSYARRLTRSGWDADDLAQATFERAFRRHRELRDPSRARAWLFRIARNLHLDRVRAHNARPELRVVQPDDSLGPEPAVSPETVERATAKELDEALGLLPQEQQEAMLLCDLWGFRYDEIAEIVEAPIGTVRSRIARGRDAVAKRIAKARTEAGGAGGAG